MAKHRKFLRKLKVAVFAKKHWMIWFIIILTVLGIIFFLSQKNSLLFPPKVLISSANLSQADTFLVVVKNQPNEVTGTFNSKKIYFLKDKNTGDWVSIVGIVVNQKPGDYPLTISREGKTFFEKNITVTKRDFPTNPLVVTPPLIQKGYTAQKIVTTIVTKENVELNKVLKVVTPKVYFTKPFIYPLNNVTVVGDFGDKRTSQKYGIQHLGVDLRAQSGTPVRAANNGKVIFIKSLPNYGKMIIIDHGLGICSLYLHLSDVTVTKGAIVNQGNVIAFSGDTGYATGPHLHFSIKMEGAAVDPLRFIKATQEKW